jgi:hypothetical protein
MDKCINAGEANFSDFINMKRQVLNNAESLYHYFDKYEKSSIVLHHHNKKIRGMRDMITLSDTAVNGMLTNLGWSEIGTKNRFQPLQSETSHLSQQIPAIPEIRADVPVEASQRRSAPFQETYLDKLSTYLTSSSDVLRKNKKSTCNVQKRLEDRYSNRRAAQYPEKAAFERIKQSIEAYASSLLESQIYAVTSDSGAFMESYHKAYNDVQKDIKEIKKYTSSIKSNTHEGSGKLLTQPLEPAKKSLYELHLNRFIARSKELRLKIVREAQDAQNDYENHLTGSHEDILFRNMEEYSRALRSPGNFAQKISTSVFLSALNHAGSGFPSA